MKIVPPLAGFLICLLAVSEGYKILINAPRLGHSHVNFMGRIADILVTAGHEVVVFVPNCDPYVKTNGSKLARIMRWRGDLKINAISREFINEVWSAKSESVQSIYGMVQRISKMQVALCKSVLQDEQLLATLKAENFDLGISELISFCGLAMFEKIGLKNHISALATVLIEGITEKSGVINNPSFVPAAFSPNNDEMSYFQRVQNTIIYLASRFTIKFITEPLSRQAIFKFMPPEVNQEIIAMRSSFVFVNADELLEFPRPITHKVIYVGGIAVPKPQPLSMKLEQIMQSSKNGVVLVSFGSIARSSCMGNDTKAAFIEAFKHFSNINFIWKYEEDDDVAEGLSNVYKIKWIPQNDLLNHPKMRAFITHGGLNSITESVHAAVPLVCIPLFGDQMRNAKMVEKRKIGVILDKKKLQGSVIVNALEKVLNDKSFLEESRRLAAMIANKPMPPEERIVKYVEFTAKYGPLSNLNSASLKLNFLQFYLLDIIIPFCIVVILIMYIFLRLSLFLCRNRKIKKE